MEIVRLLLLQNCDVRRQCTIAGRKYELLTTALRNGYKQLIRLLVTAGCSLHCYLQLATAGSLHQSLTDDPLLFSWLHETATSPRSLLQQCRLVVRQSLSCNIASEVQCLPLPTTLKEYIMLKNML